MVWSDPAPLPDTALECDPGYPLDARGFPSSPLYLLPLTHYLQTPKNLLRSSAMAPTGHPRSETKPNQCEGCGRWMGAIHLPHCEVARMRGLPREASRTEPTGECTASMSGPTCRIEGCPPCQHPEMEAVEGCRCCGRAFGRRHMVGCDMLGPGNAFVGEGDLGEKELVDVALARVAELEAHVHV